MFMLHFQSTRFHRNYQPFFKVSWFNFIGISVFATEPHLNVSIFCCCCYCWEYFKITCLLGWMRPLITVWYIYSQCLWNRPWNNQKDIIHQMSFYFALMSSSPMKKKNTHTTGYRYTLYFLLITVEVLVHLSKPRCARLFKSPPRFLYLAH